jgi:hypothetical protein
VYVHGLFRSQHRSPASLGQTVVRFVRPRPSHQNGMLARHIFLLVVMTEVASFPAVLHYFDGKGRANPIRFLLEETGTAYREELIRDASAMAVLRQSGKLMYGQVPMLEIDGINLVQACDTLRM